MKIYRTPDTAFELLEDYPFAPHYCQVSAVAGDSLRMHYVSEGSGKAGTLLLLHGNPSWSYLYRHMIRELVAADFRCIAPDLIGFGRSDKPASRGDYSYLRHVQWLGDFVRQVVPLGTVMFAQDWGGLIGLRVLVNEVQRFDRVMISNTGLPTGDAPPTEAFMQWRNYSQKYTEMDIPRIIGSGVASGLSARAAKAYAAPFPDESYRMGARQFPLLVPASPDDPENAANRAAWEQLENWEKPFVTAFGDSDAVFAGGDSEFQRRVPGAAGQRHGLIAGGAHFLQEDCGEELARRLIAFAS